MTCKEKALEYFDGGYNCAQAAFAGCGQVTGLDQAVALAASGGFGGGMRMGSICGAVTGGLMALGCVFPYTDSARPADRDRIGQLTLEFLARFKEQNGCLDCDGLVQGDKAAARQSICPKAVASAAEIVEAMAKEFGQG